MLLGFAQSLFQLFRENSDVVPVSQLKRKGIRSVTVLDWDRVQALIAAAVEEALSLRGVGLAPAALESVNQEAREAFVRLVEQRDSYRETAESLAAEKRDLLSNLDRLRAEFEQSKGALAQALGAEVSVADVPVSAEGMEEYQRRLSEEIARLVAQSPPDLAERISAVARRLMDDEREKAAAAARSDQQHRIAQLERRVQKLRETLSATEQMVERLRVAKGAVSGVESIYREVQGLDESDILAQEKRGLLEEIFKLNVELREVIAGQASNAAESSSA